jgi:hypothetical protein
MQGDVSQPDSSYRNRYDQQVSFKISPDKPKNNLCKNKVTQCERSKYDKTNKTENCQAEKIRYVKGDACVSYETLNDICKKKSDSDQHRHSGENQKRPF